jgi:hypothetical protein
MRKHLGALAAASLLAACTGYDSDFVPYGLTGLDVYVYHQPSGREHFVRRVDATYWTRARGLTECNSVAVAEANQREWLPGDWSYVCCTVTSSHSCMTKVR